MATTSVAWLAIAPVKGMRLQELDAVDVEPHGVRGDRRFALVDGRGHLVNGKQLGALMRVVVAPAGDGALTLTFPNGESVSGAVTHGSAMDMVAYGQVRAVRPVLGPWSQAISLWAGRELRLVEPLNAGDGLDRQRQGGVTLLSMASLEQLGDAAGSRGIDRRRFRMNVGIEGAAPFAEESWMGRDVRLGRTVVVRIGGNVGRCAVTTKDPGTGVADIDTLRLIGELRRDVDATEPLPFGVWGAVVTPGRVSLGDAIEPEGGGPRDRPA